jgi:hypothetical protein
VLTADTHNSVAVADSLIILQLSSCSLSHGIRFCLFFDNEPADFLTLLCVNKALLSTPSVCCKIAQLFYCLHYPTFSYFISALPSLRQMILNTYPSR